MAELPRGTVTFLFTDLEGSSRLWEQHPDAMEEALARHDSILREAVESHDGHVVKTTGDGAHAVFATARDAVGAAVVGQQGLADERWGSTGRLRVRMGIHTGEAQYREGDYYGPALNRAARLAGVAHGGQVVCSQATADLARDGLPDGLGLVDLGEHRLRDLSRPERVFEVQAPGLEREFGPLASLDAFPGNLPLQVSSFIGRDRELARVATALSEGRVVTLTGVGGVGKTRLALQVAAEVLPQFREGAWLCELAAIRDPEGVVGAVAAVFGVTARAGQTLTESLVEFLGTKQLLLVLDNCEHLLDAVADLVEILERSCAGLVVMATSREGLALDGERMLAVPSLAEPATDADLDSMGQSDAVRLFVDRARLVDADFGLSAENGAAVAQVCRRLDGVPLAIELAAARVRAMNPGELAQGLDRRFDMLSGGRRRAVQRHQTLRAAIDWSYELLSEAEQRLLARLAVFAGGATRDAVEAVCGGDPIKTDRVFGLLASLVDRSLVVAQRDAPATRYRLLETIREYGEERLGEHGETEALRARHAAHYTEFAGAISEQVEGPHQLEAARRLAVEYENLLAAANFTIDSDDADLGLRLVRNAPTWGWQIGYELRLPVESILHLPDASQHSLYPFGLAVAALYAGARGDAVATEGLCEQALAAVPDLESDPMVSFLVSGARAAMAFSIGAWDEVTSEGERGAHVARVAGRPAHVANALVGSAVGYAMAGDSDAAAPLATEALAIARDLGAPILISASLSALAGALADREPRRAEELLHENRQLRASLDYEGANEITEAVLISARIRDWPQTLELASSSIRHLHWRGDLLYLAGIFNLAARAAAPSDPEPAAVLQGAAHRLTTTGRAEAGTVQTAATATGAEVSTPKSRPAGTTGLIADLRRETTTLLRQALGEARLRELRGHGEAMNTDDAVAYALDSITRTQHHMGVVAQGGGL